MNDPGSAAALTRAKQILLENPDALAEGVALLRSAADQGNGEATAKLAHVTALGISAKPDWDQSLDLLARAAELGWSLALDELRLLASDPDGAPSELRKRVDIAAFVSPRPTAVVSASPRVRTLTSFMSSAECGWLIERGRPRLKRATVFNNKQNDVSEADERSNTAAGFPAIESDLALVLLQQRIANSIGAPKEWFEAATVLHYDVGEKFLPHVDYLDPVAAHMAEGFARQGQRIATFLVYLNDDFEGGETDFPRLGYRFKGKAGDALVFANVDLELGPDPRTLHAGLAPTKGEKWLLSQWVRDRPVR